jgi:hypothetical protein
MPKRTKLSGLSKTFCPWLLVSRKPFSAGKLAAATTTLEFVIAGRSVAIDASTLGD